MSGIELHTVTEGIIIQKNRLQDGYSAHEMDKTAQPWKEKQFLMKIRLKLDT